MNSEILRRLGLPDVNDVFQALQEGRDVREVLKERLAAKRLAAVAEQIAAAREARRMASARGAKRGGGRDINAVIQRYALALWAKNPALRDSPYTTAGRIMARVNAEVGQPPLRIDAIAKRLSRMKN